MAQIQKKFIAANAVDETKIRLSNDAFLRARNAANSADISILKVNASDRVLFSSIPQVASDPSAANDLVRKSYIDAVLQGLKPKEACVVATVANVNLSSAPAAIDGVTLTAGDRVLVKDQTLPEENGIYDFAAAASPMTRSSDFDSLSPINEIKGAYTAVMLGTVNAGKFYVESANPVTLGVDPITFVFFNSVASIVAGNGIDVTGSTISVLLSATPGLEFSSGALQVKVNAAGAIARGASGLNVIVEASNPSLEIVSNELKVRYDGSTIESSASGIRVKDAGITNAKVATGIDAAKLADGSVSNAEFQFINSLTSNAQTQLNAKLSNALTTNNIFVGVAGVATDVAMSGDATIVASGALTIANSAITTAKIANDAVDKDKINADVAGSGLGQNVDGSLEVKLAAAGALQISSDEVSVKVDAATVKINGSNNLESLKPLSDVITLNGTDITNQYVDLSFVAYSASAIQLIPVGGIMQRVTTDFTVSLTGGAGGVTRITFAGDLATGGNSALISGDVLMIYYSRL